VLPRTSDAYQQVPAFAISAIALLISVYTLKKNLGQKRDEHRAKFFHDLAVAKGVDPILKFYSDFQQLLETEGVRLAAVIGSVSHDDEVRAILRRMREMKREAANRIGGLAAPFSSTLENQIQATFDAAYDDSAEWLEVQGSGGVPQESIGRTLAASQRTMLELLREHEFELGWPPLRVRIRRLFTSRRQPR
jgi:hypothetical protein